MMAWNVTEGESDTPFLSSTAIATPICVLVVCRIGFFWMIAPKCVSEGMKTMHGILKTAEISLASAIQASTSFLSLASTKNHSAFNWEGFCSKTKEEADTVDQGGPR